jgi:hypothetical protein
MDFEHVPIRDALRDGAERTAENNEAFRVILYLFEDIRELTGENVFRTMPPDDDVTFRDVQFTKKSDVAEVDSIEDPFRSIHFNQRRDVRREDLEDFDVISRAEKKIE